MALENQHVSMQLNRDLCPANSLS